MGISFVNNFFGGFFNFAICRTLIGLPYSSDGGGSRSWRYRVCDCKITVAAVESTVRLLETCYRLFTEIEALGLNPDFLEVYGSFDDEEEVTLVPETPEKDLPTDSPGDTTTELSPCSTIAPSPDVQEEDSDDSYSILQPKKARIQ